MRYALLGGLLGAVLAAAVLAACGGGSGSSPGANGPVNPALGVWERVSGTLPLDESGLPLTYLSVSGDGFLSAFGRNPTLNVLGRTDGVQGPAGAVTLFYQTRDREGGELLKMAANPAGSDTLGLMDVRGNAALFERRSQVPPSAQPLTFATVVRRFDDLGLEPSSWTGLAWDGSRLWFTAEDDDAYPVDPATGALGAPVSFSTQFEMVHAIQAGDFWNHCRCGNGQEVERLNLGGSTVDSVDTRDWIGGSPGGMAVNAIAWDPASFTLWLHGFDWDVRRYRFLRVDSDAEPETLIGSGDFDVRIQSMTWDGTFLWALLSSGSVAQIDPGTLQAAATYLSPDPTVQWYGIASAPATAGGGSSLFLVGWNESAGRGELIEVKP